MRAGLLTVVRHTRYSWFRRHKVDARATEFGETVHGDLRTADDPEAEMLRGGTTWHRAAGGMPYWAISGLNETELSKFVQLGGSRPWP